MNENEIIKYAKNIVEIEKNAVTKLRRSINKDFAKGVKMISKCKGRVVLTGMGKAGVIAMKISATFASTGTPSYYIHPAEAYHGDLGRIVKDDIIVAVSNSGETEEILKLIPHIKKFGIKIMSITSSRSSTLGKFSDLCLETGKVSEACPLGLAPSASTTAELVMGDALALTVLKEKKYDEVKFASFHPGGSLGLKYILVKDIMRKREKLPVISENNTIKKALITITKHRAGAVVLVNGRKKITGIFTDGDFRRLMKSANNDVLRDELKKHMTKSPITIKPDSFALDALSIMKEKKIDEIPVVNEKSCPVGMLDIQDLIGIGLT